MSEPVAPPATAQQSAPPVDASPVALVYIRMLDGETLKVNGESKALRPGNNGYASLKLPAGETRIELEGNGRTRTQTLDIAKPGTPAGESVSLRVTGQSECITSSLFICSTRTSRQRCLRENNPPVRCRTVDYVGSRPFAALTLHALRSAAHDHRCESYQSGRDTRTLIAQDLEMGRVVAIDESFRDWSSVTEIFISTPKGQLGLPRWSAQAGIR